jgi:hypothetical protein
MAKNFIISSLLSKCTAVDGGGVAVPSRSVPLSR